MFNPTFIKNVAKTLKVNEDDLNSALLSNASLCWSDLQEKVAQTLSVKSKSDGTKTKKVKEPEPKSDEKSKKVKNPEPVSEEKPKKETKSKPEKHQCEWDGCDKAATRSLEIDGETRWYHGTEKSGHYNSMLKKQNKLTDPKTLAKQAEKKAKEDVRNSTGDVESIQKKRSKAKQVEASVKSESLIKKHMENAEVKEDVGTKKVKTLVASEESTSESSELIQTPPKKKTQPKETPKETPKELPKEVAKSIKSKIEKEVKKPVPQKSVSSSEEDDAESSGSVSLSSSESEDEKPKPAKKVEVKKKKDVVSSDESSGVEPDDDDLVEDSSSESS